MWWIGLKSSWDECPVFLYFMPLRSSHLSHDFKVDNQFDVSKPRVLYPHIYFSFPRPKCNPSSYVVLRPARNFLRILFRSVLRYSELLSSGDCALWEEAEEAREDYPFPGEFACTRFTRVSREKNPLGSD